MCVCVCVFVSVCDVPRIVAWWYITHTDILLTFLCILCTLCEMTIKVCATILKVAMCFRSAKLVFFGFLLISYVSIGMFRCRNEESTFHTSVKILCLDINLMISCSANWYMLMDQFVNKLLIIQAYQRNPVLCVAYIAVRVIPAEMPVSTQKTN